MYWTKERIAEEIRKKEKEYGITPYLLLAICDQESNYDVHALGGAGEIGLFQLLPQGAIAEYNQRVRRQAESWYWDVQNNIHVGAWFVGKRIPELLKYYKKSITINNVLWAYNAGIGNLNNGNLPLSTEDYIEEVKDRMVVFKGKMKEPNHVNDYAKKHQARKTLKTSIIAASGGIIVTLLAILAFKR